MNKPKIKKQIFLESLPRTNIGIDWEKTEGYIVKGIYDNMHFEVKILQYKKEDKLLIIEYNKKQFSISRNSFLYCSIGKILKKKTSEFKIEIGETFKDDKRDITVTDREIRIRYDKNNSKCNDKYYKYTCNICGWTEGWMIEGSILNKHKIGCSCCSGKTLVQGINDIPTTAPFMIKYFQGGIEEAKLYTKYGSRNKNNPKGYIYPICPDCGRVKDKAISVGNIYRTHSIGCSCSDKSSYGEKFMFSCLEQLSINFQTQLSKVNFDWCDKYKYDFYFELNDKKYIIESNGNQHYEKGFDTCGGDTTKDVQLNDKLKKELALSNGIKEENYIVIDCRYSELDFIKNNILGSRLNELFDLNKIDWMISEEFALKNRVKTACEYKKNNPDLTCEEISKIMNISGDSVRNYLKKGTKYNWCYYNAEEELKKGRMKKRTHVIKMIEIFKDGISLGVFKSAVNLQKQSEKLFGTKLLTTGILNVCKKKAREYKGYTFEYVETN